MVAAIPSLQALSMARPCHGVVEVVGEGLHAHPGRL